MKLTTILKVIKPVTSLVAASATGLVVKNVITATTPADLGKYQSFMVKAGGFFVGGAVGGIIGDRVDKQFDDLIKAVETITDPDLPKKILFGEDKKSTQDYLNSAFEKLDDDELGAIAIALQGDLVPEEKSPGKVDCTKEEPEKVDYTQKGDS